MLLKIGSRFEFEFMPGGIYLRIGQRDFWWERTARYWWQLSRPEP